ncbi:MAG: pilus assembly protein TadG-related protein [Firmicutes bacterium]|nr:pilus assembly protein TadG-related protein [Bacillota bacterium]
MKNIKQLVKEEKGSAIVLYVMVLSVLLGASAIVIDYGMLAVCKRKLTNAADAAALAGAQELLEKPHSPTSAINIAQEYAAVNGAHPANVTVSLANNNSEITVTVADTVNYFFAPILGFTKGDINAQAIAATGTVSSLVGIVPLTIVEQALIKGQEYELKSPKLNEVIGPGNFGVLALGGTGASKYEKNLREGYQGSIKIGDILETEPGNMSNPTKRAIEHRVNQCNSGCTHTNFLPGCKLLIYLPVIKQPTGQGRQDVEVVGFAAFFLNRNAPPGQGNESIIRGYFVDTIVPGQITPGSSGFGVSAINLTK